MKEKYGSDFEEEGDEETDSESEESEDEEGEELTPAVDAAILRTLARIKRKDPEIYNSGKDVFEGILITAYPHCTQYFHVEEKQKISSTTIKGSVRKDKVSALAPSRHRLARKLISKPLIGVFVFVSVV